jgi:hypothetical protein
LALAEMMQRVSESVAVSDEEIDVRWNFKIINKNFFN